MCGIVGALAKRDITRVLIQGLQRLEYRGYDSAGVAVIDSNGSIQRRRTQGKVQNLQNLIDQQPLSGFCGISHTRWATHGVPSEANAHPHQCNDSIVLVHNGIIENHESLRKKQIEQGHEFDSETDTEVIVHAVYDQWKASGNLLKAVQETVKTLQGAYALGVVEAGKNDRLIAARKGSPLVIGLADGEYFIASDVFALLGEASQFIYLEDGDIADIRLDGVTIYDESGSQVSRAINETELKADTIGLGRYSHYMQKEILSKRRY